MVQNLYCNFQTSILITSYQTTFLKVGRGVLQGDCLSPLTFNLCFCTFIEYISYATFTPFGFGTSTLSPLHCFQFANDAAVVTEHGKEKQTLLHHCMRWCTWLSMVIRVARCVWSSMVIRVARRVSFRIKQCTSCIKFLPNLIINRKTGSRHQHRRVIQVPTMSAKSLGTLPVIYAVDEKQIPSPIKQCCFKVIQIALEGEMMSFQVVKGFGYRFNIV